MPYSEFSNVTWRKSSHSASQTDQCVEIAIAGDLIGIRDSKDPGGPTCAISRTVWRSFVEFIKDL